MTQTAATPRTTIPERMRASVLTALKTLSIEQVPTPPMESDEVLVEVAAVGVCGSDTITGTAASATSSSPGPDPRPRVVGPDRRCRRGGVGDQDRRTGGDRAAEELPPMPGVPRRPLQPLPEHGVLRHPAHRRRIRAILRDPNRVRPQGAGLHIGRGGRSAGATIGGGNDHAQGRGRPGSSILIAGAGPIGIICAQAARAFGAAEIIVTDLVPERRERALRFGATRVLDPRETDIANAGLDVNAFVDASGSPHAVMSGIKAVRPAGAAVLVGLGSSEMTLPVDTSKT